MNPNPKTQKNPINPEEEEADNLLTIFFRGFTGPTQKKRSQGPQETPQEQFAVPLSGV